MATVLFSLFSAVQRFVATHPNPAHPPLTADGRRLSPEQLYHVYEQEYYAACVENICEPYIIPYQLFSTIALIVYFMLPRPQFGNLSRVAFWGSLDLIKVPLLAWNFHDLIKLITRVRTSPVATGGTGLIASFVFFWMLALMVILDAKRSTARLKMKGAKFTTRGWERDGRAITTTWSDSVQKPEMEWEYFSDCDTLLQRMDWSFDLITSVTGSGWLHQTRVIEAPPKEALESAPTDPVGLVKSRRSGFVYKQPKTTRDALKMLSTECLIAVMVLDVVMALIRSDPYFIGYLDAPAPAFFPSLLQDSSLALHGYRLVLYVLSVRWCLALMLPSFQILLISQGAKWGGPRAEAFKYHDIFGSYVLNVGRKGLAGWWGASWHQSFRLAFELPATFLLRLVGLDHKKSLAIINFRAYTAFAVSAAIHASGVATMWAPQNPWRVFAFFLIQPVGFAIEGFVAKVLRASNVSDRTPSWVKFSTRFVWVHLWYYYTGSMFMTEIAKGGIWLLEPLPVSFSSFLGMKNAGSWWRWQIPKIPWHSDAHWYKSGLAI